MILEAGINLLYNDGKPTNFHVPFFDSQDLLHNEVAFCIMHESGTFFPFWPEDCAEFQSINQKHGRQKTKNKKTGRSNFIDIDTELRLDQIKFCQ